MLINLVLHELGDIFFFVEQRNMLILLQIASALLFFQSGFHNLLYHQINKRFQSFSLEKLITLFQLFPLAIWCINIVFTDFFFFFLFGLKGTKKGVNSVVLILTVSLQFWL